MVEFKEKINKNAYNKYILYNKYIFDPIKREKWKSLEDTVKKTTKIKIEGKIKDIVKQKISLGYLQQNQIKVNQLSILKMPCPSHLPVSLPLASADGTTWKTKKSNLYGATDSLSHHNTSLENYTGVNYLLVDVASA